MRCDESVYVPQPVEANHKSKNLAHIFHDSLVHHKPSRANPRISNQHTKDIQLLSPRLQYTDPAHWMKKS
jgi:hypothetical protein